MQCSACRAVYASGLEICPRCQTPAPKTSAQTEAGAVKSAKEETAPVAGDESARQPAKAKAAATGSTLIEFPGAHARPQWRKDLSERVREIQERRARESTREGQDQLKHRAEPPVKDAAAPPLGLVPQPDQPQMNPIVVAALKRLERAQQPQPRTRQAMGGAAVAVARVAEEQYQLESQVEERLVLAPLPEPITEPLPAERPVEAPREHTLTVVQTKAVEKAVTVTGTLLEKRATVEPVAVAQPVETQDSDAFAFEELYDDRAPVFSRLAAGLIDLLVIAFASSPFAAIIELTNGNWTDERVLASMGGILLLIMFLYLTTSTALAGRTWGMSLVSLRAVDVDTGLPPTTKQSVTRAVAYMISLLTVGFGILYALFDAEGRTVHDHLSGTAVVRE
jgi:uncharacterized RDD family membrane protein YckC